MSESALIATVAPFAMATPPTLRLLITCSLSVFTVTTIRAPLSRVAGRVRVAPWASVTVTVAPAGGTPVRFTLPPSAGIQAP